MSLTAVWSFWSAPYLASRQESWAHDWFHWLAWGLSVHTAAQHYPETSLVTDSRGAHVLVDLLGLPFTHVSTALDRLSDADPGWWALGKLEAYRLQERPFIHLDTDVFLWNRLPDGLEQASVFVQNPEPITYGLTCYAPVVIEQALGGTDLLPLEWRWYRSIPGPSRAECCGILGGQMLDFIQYYATMAGRLVREGGGASALRTIPDKPSHMILIEQYLLSACVDYHHGRVGSPFSDVTIGYLFDDLATAYHPESALRAGYTHLAAGAKKNGRACRLIEARVRELLPEYYDRCCQIFGRHGSSTGDQLS